MTAAQKKQELIRLFGSYSKRLERLYDQYATDLVGLGLHESLLEEDPLFHFDDFPQHRESLNNIFSDFVRKQLLTIKAAIADGVTLAFLHDKGDLQGASVLGNAAITHARETAADAFYRGRMKPQQGLSLSQLVWNYSQQTKSEFEMAMSTVIAGGLQQGTSAEELGRKVRHLLNNPDMMHRRYHEKVLRNGERVDVVTWRRRVIGEDGKVHFVKEPLEKVGRGHYRSARMNAYRLMRSEINMAYHRANHERWMQEPFVIGIHIWPSDQHPMEDVCDELKGDYPKDFLFLGWHPACMDTCTPITLKGDERKEYLKRIAKGEDVSGYVSPNRVRDVPDGYKRYIAENADRIISADRRDKLAYHLRDNRKYWEEIVQQAIAQKQKPVPKTLKHIDEAIESAIEANGTGSLSEAEQAEIRDYFSKLLAESDYGMLVPRIDVDGNDVIDAIFSSYFKNQLETGTGGGAIDKDFREEVSKRLFGTRPAEMEPEDYEKYGLLLPKKISDAVPYGNNYWNYGDGMQVRFKKDMVQTTFCLRDSFSANGVSKTDNIQMSFGDKYEIKEIMESWAESGHSSRLYHTMFTIGEYVELQYHGKLTLDCIESVFLPQQTLRRLKPGTFEKIKKVGCIVYTTDVDGKLITL